MRGLCPPLPHATENGSWSMRVRPGAGANTVSLVFGRSSFSKTPEDPSVAVVEALLDAAATHLAATALSHGSRPIATHALWICACVTLEDAPIWLIYEDTDGGIVWCRIPDEAEAADVVEAEFSAGGHANPGDVLAWLQGEAPDPWACGDGSGDDGVLGELVGKIRGS